MDIVLPEAYKKYTENTINKRFLELYIPNLIKFYKNKQTPIFLQELAKKVAKDSSEYFEDLAFVIQSGYPTCVMDIDPQYRNIPEYERFYTEKLNKTQNIEKGVPCFNCINENKLESFFPFCKTCLTPFGIRDVIELYPDIDIILVFKDLSDIENLSERLEKFREKYGYISSKENYKNKLINLSNVLSADNYTWESILSAIKIDILIVDVDSVKNAYKDISEGNINSKIKLLINKNNKFVEYEDNLATELFISQYQKPLFINNKYEELADYIEYCKHSFAKKLGPNPLSMYIDILKNNYIKNYNIIISSQSLKDALKIRINKYINLFN